MKNNEIGAAEETRRIRKPRAIKKRKSPDDDSNGSTDKKPKTEEPSVSEVDIPSNPVKPQPAKRQAVKNQKSQTIKSNEMEFGLHIGNLASPLMTFETTVRALLKTLNHGANITLAEHNMSSCAECRGGGDLLCCDCCQFAFHVDCLGTYERGSYLHVPYRKYGLRQMPEGYSVENETLMLEENEWFCPYCLSAPVQRYWKRGIPQFLATFPGFEASVVARNDFERSEGQLAVWCDEVEEFMGNQADLGGSESFPPSVLLAMTGIRRAIQRLGPAFQKETKAEVERLEQHSVQNSSPTPPLVDVAEPVDVKEETAKPKTTIMRGGSRNLLPDEPDQPPSDEAMSESEATKPVAVRSRSRRARVKPIVPTDDIVAGDSMEAARMNVGGSFQVPTVHKFYTEAKELGCDYSLIDRNSVLVNSPVGSNSFIPMECIPAKNTCRLVYSASKLERKQQQILKLPEMDPARLDSTIPLTKEECKDRKLRNPITLVTIYIRQVLQLWPAWIQWPASQEYALKILHHCQYDAKSALKLLCTDGMQFRPICDPPVRPYMNKWKPRDKRGLISTIPFPPPTNALIYAGVEETQYPDQ